MARSQITIFVILGLVILGIFVGLFMVTKFSESEQAEKRAIEMTDIELRKSSFGEFVQSCVDKTFVDALGMIGYQGGYINKGQPGSIIPWDWFDTPVKFERGNRTYSVTYRISKLESTVPWYPCSNSRNPPRYCSWSNDITRYPKLYSVVYGKSPATLYVSGDDKAFSVTNQIENYIEANLPLCINTSSFRGFGISLGKPNVTVEIGRAHV